MAKVLFGNHSSVIVPRKDRDDIRKFYCDILGGEITKSEDDRDFLRLGDNFYIAFLYGDTDEGEFLRSGKSVWLEIKSDNVEEMKRKILGFGVLKLDIPDPHLYFQAPGGQVLRLVGIDEDMSFYEGSGAGPDVAKVKAAIGGAEHKTYTATIEVAQSPEDVFNHINNVSQWWATKEFKGQFQGRSTKLNDEFVVRFGEAHYSKQKLVEVIPDKKIVWLVTESKINWIEQDKTEWTNTRMVFEITTKGDKTVLVFTHEGLFPAQECYEKCEQGWDMLIKTSLLKSITEGKEMPV